MGSSRDFRQFGSKMQRAAKAIERDINQFNENVAINVQYHVASRTPVDVGTARSNWAVQLGSAVPALKRAFSPFASRWRPPYGTGGGIGERRNLEASRRAARIAVSKRKTDQEIFIVNNLPYITRLNQGHSKQAPAGFVQVGIATGFAETTRRFSFINTDRVFR